MVRAVLRQVDANVPVKTVHATRGKWLRAEPVAAMYPQGRVKHAAPMPELEDDVRLWADRLRPASCRRADAPVWAVSELIKPVRPGPRIRSLGDPSVPPWSVMNAFR